MLRVKITKVILIVIMFTSNTIALAQGQIKFYPSKIADNFIPKIDAQYFILGTLSDYISRFYTVKREKQIDKYYPNERPAIEFLSKFIKEKLKVIVDTSFNEMYSLELSKTLNNYYGIKDDLPDSIFKTDEQIYSFLLGNYYRYGIKLSDSIYSIRLANSAKPKLISKLLIKINCDKIIYKRYDNIPTSSVFYFEASPKLKKYINLIETEKIKLDQSTKPYPINDEEAKKRLLDNFNAVFNDFI